jgi:hypothetical protein
MLASTNTDNIANKRLDIFFLLLEALGGSKYPYQGYARTADNASGVGITSFGKGFGF